MCQMPEDAISRWIAGAKAGESFATFQLWQHYYEKLVRAARNKLRSERGGLGDEEDIVVSVFESFYRAAEAGRIPELTARDDLWKLLLRMAFRKVIDLRRKANRQKRGGGAQPHSLDLKEDSQFIEVIGNEPTPEMVAIMTDSFEQLLLHLGDGSLREIAVGKMEGYSNSELAEKYGCSERTIERRLRLIREKCQQEFLIDD